MTSMTFPGWTSGEAEEPIDTNFVYHNIRVMSRRLKNVTVTLEEEAARWARIEAAKRDTSVSRFLGEMLKERMDRSEAYNAARARYFSQEPGVHRRHGQTLPSRNELHERNRLR